MTSGWMPMPRSSFTECCVGFVLISSEVERAGRSVTWTKTMFWRPTALRI